MSNSFVPGSVLSALHSADRGVLPDNWTFQGLLRKYLEEGHPDPQANGFTRAEILVQAIVQGAMKQAMSGASRADIVKLVVDEVGKDTPGKNGGRGDSLTDVQFLIVDPKGDDVVLDPSVSGSLAVIVKDESSTPPTA